MKPKMKPDVTGTLNDLEVGASTTFNLEGVSESVVRTVCSRIKKATGRVYSTSLKYPNIVVIRKS